MAGPSDDPVAASVASSAPWCEDATAVVKRLVTDPERGLSTTEAARRLEEHGPNALEAAEAVPAWRKLLEQFRDPLVYLPFTSERKLMSTLETDIEREGRIDVVTKGAPDVLLARCTHERVAGEVRSLTDARRAEIAGDVERLADGACGRSASPSARSPTSSCRPLAVSGGRATGSKHSNTSSSTWAWSASSTRPGPRHPWRSGRRRALACGSS
jgi:hypothetical protein